MKLTQHNGKEGFPITALRETNVLLSLHHPNIVRVLEMVVGSTLDKVRSGPVEEISSGMRGGKTSPFFSDR